MQNGGIFSKTFNWLQVQEFPLIRDIFAVAWHFSNAGIGIGTPESSG